VSEVSTGRFGHLRVGIPEVEMTASKPHSVNKSCYVSSLKQDFPPFLGQVGQVCVPTTDLKNWEAYYIHLVLEDWQACHSALLIMLANLPLNSHNSITQMAGMPADGGRRCAC